MSGYRPKHGEHLVFSSGAWATWDQTTTQWKVFTNAGRHIGNRGTEQEAEILAEGRSAGQPCDE